MSFYWDKEVEKAWNKMADRWNSGSKQMWDNGSRKDIIPFLTSHVAGGHYLDLGCADGYGTHLLKKHGFNPVGIDISPEMIERANEQKIDQTISFFQADARELPFEAGQFDGVLAVNVLEWTEHPFDVLRELKRVIQPGGFICVGLLGPTAGPRTNSYRRLYGEPVICNTMMPWEWDQLAMENGLTLVDGFGVPKRSMKQESVDHLSLDLQQSLSFMWVSLYQKDGEQ